MDILPLNEIIILIQNGKDFYYLRLLRYYPQIKEELLGESKTL